MTKAAFVTKRNKALKTPLEPCNFCGYKAADYMDYVDHRHKEHGVKPGWSDIYGATDPRE